MPKLPVLSGKQLLKLLQKNGFIVVRQKGSHVFVENEDGELTTVIPVHGNEDLGKGILKAILNDLELSVDELVEMLK
ncbi:MAG: type II toxin-antitoxin system HicA family toxin [Candidatus Gracilibacteria bacterium]